MALFLFVAERVDGVGTGNAQRETTDVDRRLSAMTHQHPDRDCQIIAEHR